MTTTAPIALNPEISNRYFSLSGNDLGKTRIYDYGFRDYSPVMQRFTTVDPIRSGSNWYAYVGNDPINKIDLWGLRESDTDSEWELTRITDTVPASLRGDELYSYEYLESTLSVNDDIDKVTVVGRAGEIIRSEFKLDGEVTREEVSNPTLETTNINVEVTVTTSNSNGTTTNTYNADLSTSDHDDIVAIEVPTNGDDVISATAVIEYSNNDNEIISTHNLGVQ